MNHQEMSKKIDEFLKSYVCTYTLEDGSDGGLPLIDLLSPGETIAEGKQEIQIIADDLADILTEQKGECEWRQWVDWEEEDMWDTSCGKTYVYQDGLPHEHGINYCQHCGKPARFVEAPPQESE